MSATLLTRRDSGTTNGRRRRFSNTRYHHEPNAVTRSGSPAGVRRERALSGYLVNLRANSPIRPPDWRYQLAMACIEGGRRPTPGDRHLSGIFQLLRRLRGDGADPPLPRRLLPYNTALALFQGRDEPQRAILEADLLARRPPEIAGRAIGLAPAAAQSYAAVFCDGADRRHLAGVIGPTVLRAQQPPQITLGHVLRAGAFFGGPVVLDDLLHAFGLGRHSLTAPHPSDDAVLEELSRRAAISMFLLQPKPAAGRFVLQLERRYQQLDALRHDPPRYTAALGKLLRAQLTGARRLLGVAVRRNPFLAALLNPDPSPT